MSRAFIRESDDQWLSDVGPSINALITYLTRENNGVRVYELKNFKDSQDREIHQMSNGLNYTKDENGKWIVI